MTAKRGHSPELDDNTNKRLRFKEDDVTNYFEYFKSISVCFNVPLDPDIQLDSNGTVNPYDKHLPKPLQLTALTVDPGRTDEFNELCFRSEHWTSRDIGSFLGSLLMHVGNLHAPSRIYDIVWPVVSDALHLAYALVHGGDHRYRQDVTPIAETQFSIRTKQPQDVKLRIDPTFELERSGAYMQDRACLSHSEIGSFVSFAFQNYSNFDARVFLVYLLIVRAQVEDPQLCFPWPEAGCQGCTQFKDCHEVWRLLQGEMLPAPQDAPDASQDPNPGLDATDELIGLWRGWIEECGSAMDDLKRKDSHRPELESLHRAVGQAYDNSCKDSGSPEEKAEVLEWLESAWRGMVQAWSQGVREDTTACILSNMAVFQYLFRSRKTQTAVLCTPMPSHIAIPSLVGACIHGYKDAKSRQEYRRPVELSLQQSRKRRSEEKYSKDELHQGEDEVKTGATTTTRKIHLGHLHLAFNAPHLNLLSSGMTAFTRVPDSDMITVTNEDYPLWVLSGLPNTAPSHDSGPGLVSSPSPITNGAVILSEYVACGALGTVWGGNLIFEGDMEQTRTAIIAKAVTSKEDALLLSREAMLYEQLTDLDLDLPTVRYYGLFKDCDGMTILVMEDAGVEMDKFDDISLGIKYVIFSVDVVKDQ
ncbi:uncharacterized protein ARMOST_03649 [Armillaria ostoyae]|uniref:Uncharacterized protein n=1 Tax=Armillaria ostoyae TaxID=47428 RepID=A0A284QV42_ARMOS|nr:uncharacterized protein ARMOST_03649 [Armillaria ostoyae]